MFVLKSGDKFISIDHGSGGYPYATDLLSMAKIFNTIEALQQYKKFCNDFKNLEIYRISLEPVKS